MEQENKILRSYSMLLAPCSTLSCGDLEGAANCLKRIC
jgi:hypothetical protein